MTRGTYGLMRKSLLYFFYLGARSNRFSRLNNQNEAFPLYYFYEKNHCHLKTELEHDQIKVQEIIDPIDSCLLLIKMNLPLSVNLIENLVSSISYDYGSFSTTTPTYTSLATSALWQQLPDIIKRQVFDLYNGDFTYVENTILKTDDFTVYLKNHFFTSHHFNFYSVPGSYAQESLNGNIVEQLTSSLKDPKFRSAVLNIRNERIKTIRVQNWAIKTIEKVVANLKKYLNEL